MNTRRLRRSVVFLLALTVLCGARTLHAARVDIEAERFADANVDAPRRDGKPDPKLSGGHSLATTSETPIRLRYRFEAPADADYTLRVREFWPNGRSPLRWRVDEGPWTAVKQGWDLPPTARLGAMVYSEWGEVGLERGPHTLDVETTGPALRRKPIGKGGQWYSSSGIMEPQGHKLNLDVLILTSDPLIPAAETARLLRETGYYKPWEPRDTRDWYEIPFELDDGSASILDTIHPTAKPIGRDPEAVLRRDGARFEYADGRPFHIWGLSVATAPPKADAQYFARRARRLGVTVARFHSLDGGLCDVNTGKSYVLDERKLDRMEHFIACLRREGIYVLLDPLYNWQAPMVGEADGLPEDAMIRGRVKCQFYIDACLQRLNKDFIRKILTHRNPYTGMINGEDPAVAFFTVTNENSFFLRQIDAMEGSKYWAKMLTEQFNAWLLEEYGGREKLAEVWGDELEPAEDPAKGTVKRSDAWRIRGPGRRASDNARFLYHVQVAFYNSVKDYVTKELGFKHILFNGSGWFGAGWLDTLDLAANLPGMDFYDQHGYGPVRGGILQPASDPRLSRWPRYSLVERFASKTPAGYPMNVTEWNNGNGPDGPLIMAAYGALQGWDGLFQYTTKFWFDGYRDPWAAWAQAYLQYPIASLAFVRRHVAEADLAWRYVTPPERLFDATRTENPHRSPLCGVYPLIGRCEWLFGEGDPVKVDVAPFTSQDGKIAESMTGQLHWYRPIGQLRLRAPKLQGLVGAADGTPVALGDLTITLEDTGTLAVAVAAVDDRPLSESRRMMLCAAGQTKALNESEPVFERFNDAGLLGDWSNGAFVGAGALRWEYRQARAADIGAGAALALKPDGAGTCATSVPTGAESLRFQFKALQPGKAQVQVLVDGKVVHTSKLEDIRKIDEVRDVRVQRIQPVKPGAAVVIRTTGECAVPVAIDNLELSPGPVRGLGHQLVMRPPVGTVTFRTPVKAVYALDLSGGRKAEVELENGNTFRLDNTHRTPWFEIVR
jgi:hypothetical protein